MTQRFYIPFFALLTVLNCSEAPLIKNDVTPEFNNPVSMVLIPGSNLAVVANANINLDQKEGSLFAIDLDTQKILTDTFISLPSFAGKISINPATKRLYVPSRGEDSLLVYDYLVPGSGGKAISFTPVKVPLPKNQIENAIETDDNPFDSVVSLGTNKGDVVYVSNILSGSVSVIKESSLEAVDLDSEKKDQAGIPLISANNFKQRSSNPGRGANRMALSPDGKLLFIASILNNNIYVINTKTQMVEAMLDLSPFTSGAGTRGIAIDSLNRAFIASPGLSGVLIFDFSNISVNDIPYEVVDAQWLGTIYTGLSAEGVLLSPDELHLFVSNERDNNVVKIDLVNFTIETKTEVGITPSDLILDSVRNSVYVLNFLSDTISVLDLNTGALKGTIK